MRNSLFSWNCHAGHSETPQIPVKATEMDSTSASREIRIFLSSTFSDMQETRNYLTKKIFPKIEKECADRGVRFTVLDLRWGITESESKTGKVIEICIDEINRTRPFFIGLVGDRYGWIPDEEEMRRNRHLEEKYPWVREYMKRGASITEIEMQYGVLDSGLPVDAFFFLKEEHGSTGAAAGRSEEEVKLAALKAKIREKAAEGVCSADTYSSIEQLGQLVHERLMTMIDSKFPADEKLSQFDRFMLRQESELEEYRNGYIDHCERTDFLDSLLGDNRVIIADESGSGKSALLANCGKNAEIRIVRTIINDSVSSVRLLMNIFLRCLGLTDADPFESRHMEQTAPDIAATFREKGFTEDVIWIIDGLEKLPVASVTELLPLFRLPEQVKTVVSADNETYEAVRDYAQDFTCIGTRPLNKAEKVHLIQQTLQRYSKKLTTGMELHIMRCDFLSKPSMLKVFLHALIQFGVFEELDSFIHTLTRTGEEGRFMDRILEIAEEDFGREEVERLLSTLACASCGLNEKQLMEKWGYTPLAWSALYSAVEVLIYRQNGCITLRSGFRAFVSGRYLADPAATSSARDTAVSLLREEMHSSRKELLRLGSGLSFGDRLLMRIWGIRPGDRDMSRSLSVFREIVLQLIDAGQWELAADVLTSENQLFCLESFRDYEYFTVIHTLVAKGMDPRRLFPFRDMIMFSLFDGGDDSIKMLWAMFTNLSKASADIGARLRRHFARMPLKRGFRRKILQVLDKCFNTDVAKADTTDFEDSWTPGKDSADLTKLALFCDRIAAMKSLERVQKILQKSEEMAASLPDDSMTLQFFLMFIPMCLLRLGRKEEAREQYGRLLDNSATDPSLFTMLRFEFAFRDRNWNLCHEIAEELKRRAEAFPEDMKKGGLTSYLSVMTAIGEEHRYEGYDRDSLIREYRDICADEPQQLLYFADWLDAKDLNFAAAQVYGIVAEVSEDDRLKGDFLYNKGMCLMNEAGNGSPQKKQLMRSAGMTMEEAAAHYIPDGEEGFANLDRTLGQAGHCYIEAGETEMAEEIIRRKLKTTQQMEGRARDRFIAASYNYTGILCNSLCTGNEASDSTELRRIAEVGCATFVKAVKKDPEEIIYLTNLVAYAFNVRSLGLLQTDSLDDVTAFLESQLTGKDGHAEPGILSSLPPETADKMFGLACMTRREVLARRLLEEAVSTGRKINGREYYWNAGLAEICSEDPETFRHGTSAVTDTLMGIYEERPLTKWWFEVPSDKGRPAVKSVCRERGTDGLLLLWCIARCENDEAGADAIRDQIRDIVTSIAASDISSRTTSGAESGTESGNDNGSVSVTKEDTTNEDAAVEILSRFIGLHRHYQSFSTEEWIVFQGRLYRDWLPSAFDSASICCTCLGLCIDNADACHSHPLLHEFISETVRESENPAETLLRFIGDMPLPQKKTFGEKTQWIIWTLMIPDEQTDSGQVTLDDDETELLKTYVRACLKMLADDPEADSDSLMSLHKVYRRYGLKPDDKVLSATLEGLTGAEYTALAEKMMQEGYTPDIVTLGRIVREDLRTGDIDRAAEDFERFRLAASGDGSYGPAIAFLRGLLETAAGEYEKAYASFSEADRASGEMDRPEHCAEIWGDPDGFDSCLDFHLFAGAAYSGHHTKAIELAPRVFRHRTCDYPWEIDELPVCLALLKSGLYDDATILYNSQVNTSIEKGKDIVNYLIAEDTEADKAEVPGIFIERTYIRAIFMLIHIENALHMASEGERSAKLVLSIAGRLMRSWLPPMCAYEYVKAQAALDGVDPRKPSK